MIGGPTTGLDVEAQAKHEGRARFGAVVDPHNFDSPEEAVNCMEAFYPPRCVGRTMVISEADGLTLKIAVVSRDRALVLQAEFVVATNGKVRRKAE